SALLILILVSSFVAAQQKKILYNFTGGTDGGGILGGVTIHNGSLYGAAAYGGDEGCDEGGAYCGTVFQLSPPAQKGGTWTESTIYTLGQQANDGYFPEIGVVFDSAGNLYGTTQSSLYELVPGADGQWTSYWPSSAFQLPAIDKSNNLYLSEGVYDV